MSLVFLSRRCFLKGGKARFRFTRRYSSETHSVETRGSSAGATDSLGTGKPISPQDFSRTRATLELFNFPFDLMDEGSRYVVMRKLDFLVRAVFDLENYNRAAADLNVSLNELTPYDYASWHLKDQHEKCQRLQLCDRGLYSQSEDIEHVKRVFSVLKTLIPENYHDIFNGVEAEALISRARLKQNEYEFQFSVEPEIYSKLQNSIVPSLLDHGVVPEEYVDFFGGEGRFFNKLSMEISEYYARVINSKSPQERLKYQDMIFSKLDSAFLGGHDGVVASNEQSYEYRNAFFLQRVAGDSISRKLNRRVRFADFDIESRFRANSVRTCNPLLEPNPRTYFHGRIEDVSRYFTDAELSFRQMHHFNPPGIYRPLSAERLKSSETLSRTVAFEGLNFPNWEESASYPRNAAETLVSFKLWRLYNVLYPELSHSEERQLMFGEMFDISPGELTIEWSMSYPMQEHTFTEESPMWVRPWEDDSVGESVMWPKYDPRVIRGKARVVSNDGSLIRLKFEPPSQEDDLKSAIKAYLLDRANLREYQDLDFTEMMKTLTPADVLLAREKWSNMSPEDRREVEDFWSSSTVTLEDDEGLRSPRVLGEIRHLHNQDPSDSEDHLMSLLDDYRIILPSDEDIRRVRQLYASLVKLNSDYMSAGGVKEIFNNLLSEISRRIDLLNEMYPEMQEESSKFDLEKMLLDKEALIRAGEQLKQFLASERYQQLAQIERKRNEDNYFAQQSSELEGLDQLSNELPDGIYRLEKPIGELTEEEKVFAVISEFEQIIRPIKKIVSNNLVLEWAQQLFKPLEQLQKRLGYALERRYISVLNEHHRPSEPLEVREEDKADPEQVYKLLTTLSNLKK